MGSLRKRRKAKRQTFRKNHRKPVKTKRGRKRPRKRTRRGRRQRGGTVDMGALANKLDAGDKAEKAKEAADNFWKKQVQKKAQEEEAPEEAEEPVQPEWSSEEERIIYNGRLSVNRVRPFIGSLVEINNEKYVVTDYNESEGKIIGVNYGNLTQDKPIIRNNWLGAKIWKWLKIWKKWLDAKKITPTDVKVNDKNDWVYEYFYDDEPWEEYKQIIDGISKKRTTSGKELIPENFTLVPDYKTIKAEEDWAKMEENAKNGL
jgi:hypothetical protein